MNICGDINKKKSNKLPDVGLGDVVRVRDSFYLAIIASVDWKTGKRLVNIKSGFYLSVGDMWGKTLPEEVKVVDNPCLTFDGFK